MNIGILDCKVGGKWIEDVARYKERGWDVINAGALDKPSTHYDIVASTWTQLSARRLANINCRNVVVKDNDEPWNVIAQKTQEELKVTVRLIDNWGISTRVAWNREQIKQHTSALGSMLIIADSPSHDALAESYDGLYIDKCPVKGGSLMNRELAAYDCVILHLAKADFTKHWFDALLAEKIATQLLISTTRGAVMSAKALNEAVGRAAPMTAVLDWTWDREGLSAKLIKEQRIVLTHHTSYQSEQARSELTDVTIAAVEKLAKEIK